MTQPDFLKQFTKLKDANQRLKYVSSIYAIDDQRIYMKSLVPFIEKILVLNNDIDISGYNNLMILPNQFYDFYSKTKKKSLEISYSLEELGSVVFTDNETENNYITNKIKNLSMTDLDFYKNPKLFQSISNLSFIPLSEEDMERLKTLAVYINHENYQYTITKNIFPSLKKTDLIEYCIMDEKDKDNPAKQYIMFRKNIGIGYIYTLTAFLQFKLDNE